MDRFGFTAFQSTNPYTNYSFLVVGLLFFLMLILFLKKRVSLYLKKREKLKNMAEKYERKRESRSSLAVSNKL